MKLLIIAGFLGSGKTTVLLHVARNFVSHAQEVIVIENEIGEIGIDGQYLNLHGLEVQELFGGCVCCTLSVNLIETIDKICSSRRPDWIILEATGAARPIDITGNLHRLQTKIDHIQVAIVVDAGRYEMLMDMMNPLMTTQIESADVVIINKIDRVDAEKANQIAEDINQLNSKIPTFKMSADKENTLDGLLEFLV